MYFSTGSSNFPQDYFLQLLTNFKGYLYRWCQSYNQNEVHKIKEYFPNGDFTAATANNLKDPKDWLLHDEGFSLRHEYIQTLEIVESYDENDNPKLLAKRHQTCSY